MIEYDNPNFNANLSALVQGMWYSELPELIDLDRIYNNFESVLRSMENGKYPYYPLDENGFIKDYKAVISPGYLRKPGVEAITYYTFKKDHSLREMQLVNLIHYCGFVYNSLYIFDELFSELYITEENWEYVDNSNSYVVAGESFWIDTGYDDEEEFEEGVFINENNKISRWAKIEDAKMRIHEFQKSKLYYIKLDIESFFQNLYTHYFARIANFEPYKSMDVTSDYFDFLDRFHQRINDNQTKGVPAGNFSSHIGAELLMLCVDYEIREIIDKTDIAYIRYVDDMTFYSDDPQKLEEIVLQIQKILTKYRLRINGNKVERGRTTNLFDMQVSKNEIYRYFPYLKSDSEETELSFDDFCEMKYYIAELMGKKRISQIKTILSLFLKQMREEKISFKNIDAWFYYFFALVFDDESLTYHIYRVLDQMLGMAVGIEKEQLILELKNKTVLINGKYADSLLEIWHYYVLTEHVYKRQKEQLFDDYIAQKGDEDANPIILCHFIDSGRKTNEKVWKYIFNTYQRITQETDWKTRIMFSKWWLPIFKIRMNDGFNYQRFVNASLFPAVLVDLAK